MIKQAGVGTVLHYEDYVYGEILTNDYNKSDEDIQSKIDEDIGKVFLKEK